MRGDEAARRALADAAAAGMAMTTDINAFDLFMGAYASARPEQNLTAARGLLSNLCGLHTGQASMERAVEIAAGLRKAGSPLDVRDVLIGAMAVVAGASVLTRNARHFRPIEGLGLVEP